MISTYFLWPVYLLKKSFSEYWDMWSSRKVRHCVIIFFILMFKGHANLEFRIISEKPRPRETSCGLFPQNEYTAKKGIISPQKLAIYAF